MALTRVDLTILDTVNDECTGFKVADTTVYGGTSQILSSDVTSLILTVTNKSTGIYMTYTFTIVANVITACTLSLSGGTPVVITSLLTSTAWPFITNVNEFNPWGSYGVTLPDFADGVYEVDYEITGTSSRGGAPELFDYTTSQSFLVDCETSCCIAKMYASLDPDCSCSDKKSALANEAYTFLMIARASVNIGDTTKGVTALTKASNLCNCDCGCK